MLRLVVFSSKTKSYQEQKTREIAMAKPAKVILNNSCVEPSQILQCTHECILVILAAQPGPKGRLFCLHSFNFFFSFLTEEITYHVMTPDTMSLLGSLAKPLYYWFFFPLTRYDFCTPPKFLSLRHNPGLNLRHGDLLSL